MEYLITFIAGIIVGSFLNVVIYRVPRGMSVISPPSSCPACNKRIKPWFNIPLLGYLLVRGKCRHCKQPVSPLYPLVELVAGLLALLAVYYFGWSVSALSYAFLSWVLLAVALIDLRQRIIPNKILIVLFLGGVALNFWGAFIPWSEAGLGFLAGGGSMFLLALGAEKLFGKESLGMGDVKLAAVAGLFLGWKWVLIALYAGFVFAFIAIVISRRFTDRKEDAYIPLGPFLALAFLVFVYWGQAIWGVYISWIVN